MINLKNKKILLLGLGLHGGGVATARWLAKEGANVIVSDLKQRKILLSSVKPLSKTKNIRFSLGGHKEKDVLWADIIICNPGVPKDSHFVVLAKKLKKPIYNEATLFFDRCKSKISAITGTRGKSTTSSLSAAMLKNKNPNTILAGNIKSAFMLDVVDRASSNSIVVLELSSWQLEGLSAVKKSPDVALVTNLYPDHLNRYKNLKEYYSSKKEIFKYQKKGQILILNYDDKELKKWEKESKAKVYYFSRKSKVFKRGVFIEKDKVFFKDKKKEEVLFLKDINLSGEHNISNALGAIAVAKVFGVLNIKIKNVLKNPPMLTGRQEILGVSNNGALYVNDTTSTTPSAGIAALLRFSEFGKTKKSKEKNIILIAGGADKKLDYKEWGEHVLKFCKMIYLLKGEASKKQLASLEGARNVSDGHDDLKVLVKKISTKTKKGDIVLFSPSASSFNMWNHEFERGDDFIKAVKNCIVE